MRSDRSGVGRVRPAAGPTVGEGQPGPTKSGLITGKCGERGAIRRNIRGTAARRASPPARLPGPVERGPPEAAPGRNEPTFWSRENRRAPTDVTTLPLQKVHPGRHFRPGSGASRSSRRGGVVAGGGNEPTLRPRHDRTNPLFGGAKPARGVPRRVGIAHRSLDAARRSVGDAHPTPAPRRGAGSSPGRERTHFAPAPRRNEPTFWRRETGRWPCGSSFSTVPLMLSDSAGPGWPGRRSARTAGPARTTPERSDRISGLVSEDPVKSPLADGQRCKLRVSNFDF